MVAAQLHLLQSEQHRWVEQLVCFDASVHADCRRSAHRTVSDANKPIQLLSYAALALAGRGVCLETCSNSKGHQRALLRYFMVKCSVCKLIFP